MNAFHLKLIAAAAMLLDHIAYFFPNTSICFHWIGRISAPIFIFCAGNSVHYTHSKKLYLLRLYLASVFMSLFQVLSQVELNFFRTLFTITLLISILELYNKNKLICLKYVTLYLLYQFIVCYICGYLIQNSNADTESICFFLLPAVTGSLYTMEGGLIFVSLGLILYLFSYKKIYMILSYVLFVLLYTFLSASYFIPAAMHKVWMIFPALRPCIDCMEEYILPVLIGIHPAAFGGSLFFVHYEWIMVFALPVLLHYNHRRGLKVKYFFYLFYMLHIMLLWYIAKFL